MKPGERKERSRQQMKGSAYIIGFTSFSIRECGNAVQIKSLFLVDILRIKDNSPELYISVDEIWPKVLGGS